MPHYSNILANGVLNNMEYTVCCNLNECHTHTYKRIKNLF